MWWTYGIVHTKIDNNEDWYYLAEIYENGCHTGIDYLWGISSNTVEGVIEIIEMIHSDVIRNLKVVEENK